MSSSDDNNNNNKSCSERFGDSVDSTISGTFHKLGTFVGHRPKLTIALSILLTVVCGAGFARWETESRGEELWVPQDTQADAEEEAFEALYPPTARFNQMIVQSAAAASSNDGSSNNVLTKELLVEALRVHSKVETGVAKIDDKVDGVVVQGGTYTFLNLCAPAGGTCATPNAGQPVCNCLVTSVFKQWNYNLTALEQDDNFLTTLQSYGSGRDDLESVLGGAVFDDNGNLVSAEALLLNYFLADRAIEQDGERSDPINAGWEEQVFLEVAEEDIPAVLAVDYFAGRSFQDEFGSAISGDLTLVQISYIVAFVFLGATMGKIKCGTGSRWTMALAALVTVGLSTGASFGLSSAFGLFYGPVHSLLPFILLGIGVDDAFVIVNAFDRERKCNRIDEDNEALGERCARSLARAGASITVTSLTDLVAFAISSSSNLPALSSFCAFAAIGIFFLWLFASTFFTACLVLDERRQRDNRRECICCVTRGKEMQEDSSEVGEEGVVSKYFRNYHAPAILSNTGKTLSLLVFAGLLGFGLHGALNLSVEDSGRAFVPEGSYLGDWIDASDEYFPSQGTQVFVVFERSREIYENRLDLSELKNRLAGKSEVPPYIAEPVSEDAYRNVMDGLAEYLALNGSGAIGSAPLGSDGWPITEAFFVSTMRQYASFTGPGAVYAQDVSFADNGSLEAFRVRLEYVKLTKDKQGEQINDAAKLIDAMDSTRSMVESWEDLPPAFPYSDYFLTIEGFKIIRKELFQSVGLAILAVGIIVFFTVASPVTSLLITMNVAFCVVEILGFMFALGIVIDSVSVINIVLAVGLSVDYSAHVGHCFMLKGGKDKNKRATEALADIGAAVLSGAMSTFLAVVVLLFSSSYVFNVLSKQFALTVGLGLLHGLVALPVMLSTLGPEPFSSAEEEVLTFTEGKDSDMAPTAHAPMADSSSDENNNESNDGEEHDLQLKVSSEYEA